MNKEVNDTVQITDSAASRIRVLTVENTKDPSKFMRISVDGGGCSGFKYTFSFEQERRDDDVLFSKNEAGLLIDSLSLEYMRGTVVDYVQTLGFASFEIKNPNSTTRCGCGNSFSI